MANEVMCPACKENFEVEELYKKGDTVHCLNCYEELVVASVKPLKLSVSDSYMSYDEEEENSY